MAEEVERILWKLQKSVNCSVHFRVGTLRPAEHTGRRQQGVREETPQQMAEAAGSVQGKAQTLG